MNEENDAENGEIDDMSRFLAQEFDRLEPYTPGEQPQNRQYIKLNTNENPYPPSPKVKEAILGAARGQGDCEDIDQLRLYSDPDVRELCGAIAEYYGVDSRQVIVGNGSDEILAFAFLAFGDHERGVRFPAVSYGFYPVFANLFGLPAEPMPLREDFTIDTADYINCGKNVVIANPNAPTGIALPLSEIERIAATNPDHLVVVDEAYVDFGAQSAIPLVQKYDNLMVIQTFSKSRNLAGARLGFAVADQELIADMNRIKFSFNPYNVNRLSILAGTAAMRDTAYFRTCTENICKTREKTAERLKQLGFTVLPSKTNFLFVKSGSMSGTAYFEGLREKGILVRHWDKPEIEDYVRITIGTPEQMDILCQVTADMAAAAGDAR